MNKSFKVEVQTDNTGAWYGNAARYDTEQLAKEQGQSLAWRWMLVREWRVVPSEDEPGWTRDEHGGIRAIVDKKKVFMAEIIEVCKKHGLMISHEDGQGAFQVEDYTEEGAKWLQGADRV